MSPERFTTLLEAARQGSEAAWQKLYSEHAPAVLGYLRASNAPDPEDVLSEVFLQVAVSPTQKVVMRLDRERSVRPTPALVDDLEMLLGGGSVQLCGAGTRRSPGTWRHCARPGCGSRTGRPKRPGNRCWTCWNPRDRAGLRRASPR